VIARRERAVAMIPSGNGLVCHTLHEPNDLWGADPLYEGIGDVKPDSDMVTLAGQLIKRQNGKFQPEDTEDRYEARLHQVIDAKLKGEGISSEAPEETDRGNVIDLMAALKASLGQERPAASKKQKAPSQNKRSRKRA
jgi:DNA end-binding protein Ku